MTRSTVLPARYAPALCAALFFAFGLIAALTAPAHSAPRGDGEGLFLHPPSAPGLRVKAPVVAGTADIFISGITGRATVRQTFLNPEDTWVEGVYVFPLPEDAAVDRMRVRVDERIIEGKIAEHASAQKQYKRAAAAGKHASLLEQERPNLFTMSVANIPPKGRIEVEIGYQQAVAHQDGRYAIRFPMTVTPRYLSQAPQVTGVTATPGGTPLDRLKFPVQSVDMRKTNPIAIRVILEPGLPLKDLQSPSHQLRVDEAAAGRYDITLKSGVVATEKDFVLEWSIDAPVDPVPALFVEEKDGAAYLLAMIVPPKSYRETEVRQLRDVVFVIDTSGSMHGESIRQARDALKFAIGRLSEKDRFNLVAFSDKPRGLFTKVRFADAASKDVARSFVDSLDADGGTEIGLALSRALENPARADRLQQVVLLTDGAVGNEPALLSRLRRTIGETRLFTVAIGSAPNGHFMREAARLGRGAMMHVSDISQIRRKISALFAKLERPALTDIRAKFPRPEATTALPSPIPDLYYGEPIVLTARMPSGRGEVVLTGQNGSKAWRIVADLEAAQVGQGVAKLWARAMVDRETGRLQAGANRDEVKLAVLDLALRHGLLTDYTSLIAVDETPTRPEAQKLATRKVPVNPPAGWTPPNANPSMKHARQFDAAQAAATTTLQATAMRPAPTVSLGAQTATPAVMLALIGLLALLAAGAIWVGCRRFAT